MSGMFRTHRVSAEFKNEWVKREKKVHILKNHFQDSQDYTAINNYILILHEITKKYISQFTEVMTYKLGDY